MCEKKTQQFGVRPGPSQIGLYSLGRWLGTGNFGFRKLRNGTIRVGKTKALISDLRLCFRLCRLLVFPCGGSFFILNSTEHDTTLSAI